MGLRRLRILISLLVLALTGVLFLDIHGAIPDGWAVWVLYPQLVPSLIHWLGMAGWAATGFLLVLLLTLLLGRGYCSFLCPLGTLQDIIIRLGAHRSRHRRFHYRRPHPWLRHGVLALTVGSALLGSLLPLLLLDPFSIFGRTISQLVRPVVIGANDLAGRGLEQIDVYALAPVGWPPMVPAVLGLTLGTVALVAVMAARHGRLFCNTLCPVGTLLGLISRHAAWRVRIDHRRCTHCAECAIVCKAGCIDLRSRSVDASRCVLCFNCTAVCPGSGIGLQLAWRRAPTGPTVKLDPSRRLLLGGGLAFALGVDRLSALPGTDAPPSPPRNRLPTRIPVPERQAIAPPGARSTARFNARCTACGLCVSACPTQVIQPALLAYGPEGLFQPTLDFAVSFCNYDCVRCGAVCPTGAITQLTLDDKHQVQLGQVEFIEDNCVVVTDLTACGACAEHCPTKAVRMVSYRPTTLPTSAAATSANLTIPKLDQSICVGCGACEYACPTRPHRAIYVRGEPVHGVAEAPPAEPLPELPAASGDDAFPF